MITIIDQDGNEFVPNSGISLPALSKRGIPFSPTYVRIAS